MINPKDIEMINAEDNNLDPEFIKEFENGKGDDEDE